MKSKTRVGYSNSFYLYNNPICSVSYNGESFKISLELQEQLYSPQTNILLIKYNKLLKKKKRARGKYEKVSHQTEIWKLLKTNRNSGLKSTILEMGKTPLEEFNSISELVEKGINELWERSTETIHTEEKRKK